MRNLKGKKIILFIPYGRGIYGSAISDELVKRGADVFVYDERPSQSTFVKVATRLIKNEINLYFNQYINGIINLHKQKNIDYLIVIRGEAFSSISLRNLKKAFPNAKFTLYLWDSIKYTQTNKIFPYFEKILSFDKEDVSTYCNLIHRPLFFIPEYRNVGTTKPGKIDVLFIGKIHSDRFGFLNYFDKYLKDNGLVTFFYFNFPSRLLYLKMKLTDKSFIGTRMSDFNFNMIPATKAAEYLQQAKCSLDIQHPLQTGLTMRTIEVLGAKRKLITTNQTIKTYDFYNENNIMVVNRVNPVINIDFILSPYQDIDNTIYEQYSLEVWLDDILN
jgi:hypothetical protein